ncbi:hypothetical protein ROS1_15420 [Roseibium sp. ROS1]
MDEDIRHPTPSVMPWLDHGIQAVTSPHDQSPKKATHIEQSNNQSTRCPFRQACLMKGCPLRTPT